MLCKRTGIILVSERQCKSSLPFTAISAVSISIIGCCFLALQGSPYFVVWLFWQKLITNALLALNFYFFRPAQMYYFYNLGYSRLELCLGCLFLDFAIWITLVLITLLFL